MSGPVYRFILHPGELAPPGVKLPLGSLPPGGEDTSGYLAPHPGQLAPPGVKIPWPGQLGVKTIKACFRDEWSGVPVYLAPWRACPPGGEAASGQLAPRG